MIIEEASAETLCLSIDDPEYFHLLSLGEADETHKGQWNWKIPEMTEAMLAVYLSQDFTGIRRYL